MLTGVLWAAMHHQFNHTTTLSLSSSKMPSNAKMRRQLLVVSVCLCVSEFQKKKKMFNFIKVVYSPSTWYLNWNLSWVKVSVERSDQHTVFSCRSKFSTSFSLVVEQL